MFSIVRSFKLIGADMVLFRRLFRQVFRGLSQACVRVYDVN
jgi:hypothetical protein